MSRKRPNMTGSLSGYARIAQAEEEEEEEEEEEDQPYSDDDADDPFRDPPTISSPTTNYAAIQPRRRDLVRAPSDAGPNHPRRPRRRRTNSGVDIKAINARLERWAEEIKDRFTRRRIKGKSAEEETLEIHHTVFQAPDGMRPASKRSLELEYDDFDQRLSKVEFDDIVESVRTAIELGMHPKLISQGSSGSYFARNSGGKVVGVFKPKDEEPYASKNPKWTKWIHRNLLPFAFGRACLIPNLSYVSEAAAYVLDVQLRTNLVPYTDVVSLSSKSFHYDYWDRKAYYSKKKALPEKQGSFQVFLKGYKGATEFFREHPWPDQSDGYLRSTSSRNRTRHKTWRETCRPGSAPDGEEDATDDETQPISGREPSSTRREFWNEDLQQSFKEELEKLVILDYIMRNTDRGTDNWMIRIDKEKNEATIVLDLPSSRRNKSQSDTPTNGDTSAEEMGGYRRRKDNMTPLPPDQDQDTPRIGAIDNSLSWPWKHPDAWRSYPFGWLFLPVSLIGKPFSEKTRQHFLPLLTSKEWWSSTQVKLRNTFEMDADFKERMFARQMGVMKGQAWNVVEALKAADHGPLELTRRQRVCVWDDIVDIPVAVPLHRPSEELRRAAVQEAEQNSRRPQGSIEEEEEMDISAAHASTPRTETLDLLGVATPPGEMRENRFNHSRQTSAQIAPTVKTSPVMTKELSSTAPDYSPIRPDIFRSRTSAPRISSDAGARALVHSPHDRRRRFSLTLAKGVTRISSWTNADEDDGDLGYAAANEQQNVTRKVIVERLEMVKSKPPVFSWC